MSSITAIQRRIEYGRYYAEAELTEQAVYIKGEVPEDYSGVFLAQLQVCYAVVSVDISGRISLTTYNPPDLLNKDKAAGASIVLPDGVEVRPNSNEEVEDIISLVWAENLHLPEELKELADTMWETAQREFGEWYL